MGKTLNMILAGVTSAMIAGGIAGSAYAKHLGPIVFGQERKETIFYCSKLDDAMTIVKEYEKSLKMGETPGQYNTRISHFVTSGRCSKAEVVYTPQETSYQWMLRKNFDGRPIEIGQHSIVKSISDGKEIYAFVDDLAPPPKEIPSPKKEILPPGQAPSPKKEVQRPGQISPPGQVPSPRQILPKK